ncbi:hypothetical protein SLS62_000094 [Diatrype stigma]|uniref:DAGKc domain-containing protein n=1 Tax=Diatrype stigma TaxID=117547 RepID=A0AAN9YUQ9_9PEZI
MASSAATIANSLATPSSSSFKPEEVILIRRRRPADEQQSESSYDVFSLEENVAAAAAAAEDDSGQQAPSPSFKLAHSQVANISQLQEDHIPDHLIVEQIPAHLRSSPSRKVHVLVSTGAGTGRALEFYEAVLQPLFAALGLTAAAAASESESESGGGGSINETEEKANRYHYDLVTTTDAQSIRQFGSTLAVVNDGESGSGGGAVAHTVVILSGDGGIVELLNASASDDVRPTQPQSQTQPPPLVAILPLGTGNALFHSLHKPVEESPSAASKSSGLVQGLRTLLTGVAAPLPSFRAEFSPGSRLITYQHPDEGTQGCGDDAQKKAKAVRGGEEEHAQAVSWLRGAIVASYGFHSQLVWESDTPAYRRHGAARFGMVARQLLEESHAYDAVVEVVTPDTDSGTELGHDDDTDDDDEGGAPVAVTNPEQQKQQQKKRATTKTRKIARDRHAYVLATLVSNLEKTFTISPASRPLDGRLRLVHFGDIGGARTMDVMMRAYDGGKHVGMRFEKDDEKGREKGGDEEEEEHAVGYEEVAEVRVTTRESDPRWRKVCIDGTIVELPPGGTMTVAVEGKGKRGGEAQAHLQILVDRGTDEFFRLFGQLVVTAPPDFPPPNPQQDPLTGIERPRPRLHVSPDHPGQIPRRTYTATSPTYKAAKAERRACLPGQDEAGAGRPEQDPAGQTAPEVGRPDPQELEVSARGGRFKPNRNLPGYHTSRADVDVPPGSRNPSASLCQQHPPPTPASRFPGALLSPSRKSPTGTVIPTKVQN